MKVYTIVPVYCTCSTKTITIDQMSDTAMVAVSEPVVVVRVLVVWDWVCDSKTVLEVESDAEGASGMPASTENVRPSE